MNVADIIMILVALGGVIGAAVVGAVWAMGKSAQTESEIAARAIGHAEKTIDFQTEEIDAVRRRLNQINDERVEVEKENRRLMEKVAGLSACEQLLAKERENVVKLTNALKMMEQAPEVVDVNRLISMVTAVASGAEIKRINGDGKPPEKEPEEKKERRTIEEDIRRRVVEVPPDEAQDKESEDG